MARWLFLQSRILRHDRSSRLLARPDDHHRRRLSFDVALTFCFRGVHRKREAGIHRAVEFDTENAIFANENGAIGPLSCGKLSRNPKIRCGPVLLLKTKRDDATETDSGKEAGRVAISGSEINDASRCDKHLLNVRADDRI